VTENNNHVGSSQDCGNPCCAAAAAGDCELGSPGAAAGGGWARRRCWGDGDSSRGLPRPSNPRHARVLGAAQPSCDCKQLQLAPFAPGHVTRRHMSPAARGHSRLRTTAGLRPALPLATNRQRARAGGRPRWRRSVVQPARAARLQVFSGHADHGHEGGSQRALPCGDSNAAVA